MERDYAGMLCCGVWCLSECISVAYFLYHNVFRSAENDAVIVCDIRFMFTECFYMERQYNVAPDIKDDIGVQLQQHIVL